MATTWQDIKLTKDGKALQGKMIAGTTFTFTKVLAGTDVVPVSDLESLTDLTNPKQLLNLEPVTLNENGTATVPVLLTNDEVETTYTANQIGFYADDPDKGEILYCVAQDDEGDEIPAFKEVPNFSITWSFTMGYGNASEVNIMIDSQAFITYQTAKNLVDTHDTSPTAHEELMAKKADLDSPVFIGHPTAPTPEQGSNGRQVANAKFVQDQLDEVLQEFKATDPELERKVDGLTADVAAIAFDLAVKDLLDTSELQNVVVDKFTALDDVILVSGHHGDGKV